MEDLNINEDYWEIQKSNTNIAAVNIIHKCEDSLRKEYNYFATTCIFINVKNAVGTCSCFFCGKMLPENLVTQIKLLAW